MIGALIGMGIAASIMLVVYGLHPAPARTDAPTRGIPPRRGTRPEWAQLTPREKVLGAVGLVIGVALALFSGWIVAVLIVPITMIGLPRLLTVDDAHAITNLEALEEWVRSLRGLLGASVPLATAIVQTLPSAPTPLKEPLGRLVTRIHAHRPLDESLYAFARDVDSQVGDFIGGALIQASRVSGAGLSRTLDGIAAEVADEVRTRRDIAIERDKGITNARYLTIFTVVLVGAVVLLTTLGDIYRTPSGQVVLLGLAAAFAGCLRWVQVSARSTPAARFLIEPGTATSKESR